NSYYDKQRISFNGAKPAIVEGYSTDNYTDWAVNFIQGKERDKNKPWFLWLCYGATHGPSTPAERHKNAYSGVKVDSPKDLFGPRPGKPAYVQKLDVWEKDAQGEPIFKGRKNRTLTEAVRKYNQCALAIDEGVARLLQALRASGQLEN